MILESIMKADYKKKVEEFENKQIDEGAILLIGDSIIDFYDFDKEFNNYNTVNYGIAGDTSVGVLNRLDEVIKTKPKFVILNIGSNDIVRTTDSVETIVRRILEIKVKLEDSIPGVNVYINSLLPVLRDHEITSKAYMKHRTNDIIDEINDELSIYTKIIDVNSNLKDENNNLKLEYSTDGLHLNDLGYRIFSETLAEEIKVLNLK